jgi:hypothetical protein
MGKKTLCVLIKKGKLERVAQEVRDPKFICRKCGRAAKSKKRLCKPTSL